MPNSTVSGNLAELDVAPGSKSDELAELLAEVTALRDEVVAATPPLADKLDELHPRHRISAINMLHYLALRHRDIRPLQEKLARLGLSSLGRSESHVLASIEAVLTLLERLANQYQPSPPSNALSFDDGAALLERNADLLLGPAEAGRGVRIMVTLHAEAAQDPELVRQIIAAGSEAVRINCAHDDAKVWQGLLDNVRRAEHELGRKCIVLMDLGGPKLRTGPLEPGPAVVKWKPVRNSLGQVARPALVCIQPVGGAAAPLPLADAVLTFPAAWVAKLGKGDLVKLTDTRGASRWLRITAVVGTLRLGEAEQTAYITPDTSFRVVERNEKKVQHARKVRPLGITPTMQEIALKQGDQLILTADGEPGRAASYTVDGQLLTPACISCTLPEVFPSLQVGEPVLFDDGKFAGHIQSVTPEKVVVEITQVPPKGARLKSERSINFPESDLQLSALMPKDYEDLKFVAAHADIVGMSFVQRADDIVTLQQRLAELGGRQPGILLKIETRRGFDRLPELIWAAMRSANTGVMIARGDLAVECGYERLAEVQEEILWLCEAAHLPVVWATQVLESLAQSGIPSRAEITDAAMGERAECVMLNKGPHILEAIDTLDNILHRMQAHMWKKMAMMRRLRSWETSPWRAGDANEANGQ